MTVDHQYDMQDKLNHRELDYLSSLALGRSRRDLAERDRISYQRVSEVVNRALSKLEVDSLVDAFRTLGWLRAGRTQE